MFKYVRFEYQKIHFNYNRSKRPNSLGLTSAIKRNQNNKLSYKILPSCFTAVVLIIRKNKQYFHKYKLFKRRIIPFSEIPIL